MVLPDSFTLVTFTNATLSKGSAVTRGPLSLKCISRALAIRINTSETSIDPLITVLRSEITEHDAINLTKKNVYRFLATPTELELTTDFSVDPDVHSALDMFDNILEQYVLDFKRITPPVLPPASFSSSLSNTFEKNQDPVFDSNLRNRLILVDEETGQVVGQFEDDTFRIQQGPSNQAAREDELVIIDLDIDWTRGDGDTLQHFARVMPTDQETWITKSAGVVSDAISLGTDLLLTTITTASSYYINHSNPSPYHSNTGISGPSGFSDPIGTAPVTQPDYSQAPPPSPPQALVLLTSSNTRQGLSIAHAISTEAVKVSSKTVGFVDEMIQQVMGGSDPESIPRPSQSIPSLPAPACPLPSQNGISSMPQMSTKASLLTSVNLISSTLDSSTRRVFQLGTEQFGKIISHKYGPEVAQSSLMLAGTARNLGLVFVDMAGIGQRVLVKSVKTAFVQAL